jgi:hypothetical protein
LIEESVGYALLFALLEEKYLLGKLKVKESISLPDSTVAALDMVAVRGVHGVRLVGIQ